MHTFQQTREEYMSELEEISEAEKSADEKLAEGKHQFGKISKQVTAVDKESSQAEKAGSALGPKLTLAKEKVRKLEKRHADQEKVKSKMEQDIAVQEENLDALREDMESLQQAEAVIEKQLQKEADKGGLHLVS